MSARPIVTVVKGEPSASADSAACALVGAGVVQPDGE
jgi:hypothetical protein